ncbi:MAG: hypothetical protein MHM6MM_003904 [Cercozoa sp. M6MM]
MEVFEAVHAKLATVIDRNLPLDSFALQMVDGENPHDLGDVEMRTVGALKQSGLKVNERLSKEYEDALHQFFLADARQRKGEPTKARADHLSHSAKCGAFAVCVLQLISNETSQDLTIDNIDLQNKLFLCTVVASSLLLRDTTGLTVQECERRRFLLKAARFWLIAQCDNETLPQEAIWRCYVRCFLTDACTGRSICRISAHTTAEFMHRLLLAHAWVSETKGVQKRNAKIACHLSGHTTQEEDDFCLKYGVAPVSSLAWSALCESGMTQLLEEAHYAKLIPSLKGDVKAHATAWGILVKRVGAHRRMISNPPVKFEEAQKWTFDMRSDLRTLAELDASENVEVMVSVSSVVRMFARLLPPIIAPDLALEVSELSNSLWPSSLIGLPVAACALRVLQRDVAQIGFVREKLCHLVESAGSNLRASLGHTEKVSDMLNDLFALCRDTGILVHFASDDYAEDRSEEESDDGDSDANDSHKDESKEGQDADKASDYEGIPPFTARFRLRDGAVVVRIDTQHPLWMSLSLETVHGLLLSLLNIAGEHNAVHRARLVKTILLPRLTKALRSGELKVQVAHKYVRLVATTYAVALLRQKCAVAARKLSQEKNGQVQLTDVMQELGGKEAARMSRITMQRAALCVARAELLHSIGTLISLH